jgi:hypothetical protein
MSKQVFALEAQHLLQELRKSKLPRSLLLLGQHQAAIALLP